MQNFYSHKKENTNIILTNSPFCPSRQQIKGVDTSVTQVSYGLNKLHQFEETSKLISHFTFFIPDLKVHCSHPCTELQCYNDSVFALQLTHIFTLAICKFVTILGFCFSLATSKR
jgi:hypothetical protein